MPEITELNAPFTMTQNDTSTCADFAVGRANSESSATATFDGVAGGGGGALRLHGDDVSSRVASSGIRTTFGSWCVVPVVQATSEGRKARTRWRVGPVFFANAGDGSTPRDTLVGVWY
jgi:hypothetical protein